MGASEMRSFKGIQVLGLGVILAVQVAACGNVNPGARGLQATSERLAAQAEAIQQARAQQDRANDAWTQRLNAMAIDYQKEQARQKRADAASSQRLTKLAEFIRNGGHAY